MDPLNEEASSSLLLGDESVKPQRAFLMRTIALICAMSLSVGSHYATYVLGPLKSRLSREMGTNNTEFSLLISAFTLNSTWTPLVGGIVASKLGTTYTSIIATSAIFLGQVVLLYGDTTSSVRFMALGMFITGLGVSPLSVVQETIIVRFFKSHGMGVSLAIGLVAGKGSSFISAATSYPLTEKFGSRAPFWVSVGLTGMSMLVNLFYVWKSDELIQGAGVESEGAELSAEARNRVARDGEVVSARAFEKVIAKHRVRYQDFKQLGDVFWAYVGINVFCGTIWSPFTHLSANIIEKRYSLTESDASNKASYLLAGSIILYPITGYIIDTSKRGPTILKLLLLSSVLTLFCYTWLALPPSWTGTPIPAIATFFMGYGFSPLLLVVIVPQIVPLKFVPTALGAHKSIEQAGSTMFQTLAGWLLDSTSNPPPGGGAMQHLLNLFVIMNLFELFGVLGLGWLYRREERRSARYVRRALPTVESLSLEEEEEEEEEEREDERVLAKRAHRGSICVFACCSLVGLTWVFFLGTAYLRLRSKKERGGGV